MRTSLHIHYVAGHGDTIQAVFDDRVVDLDWSAGHWWTCEVEADHDAAYRYQLERNGAVSAVEDDPFRTLPSGDGDRAIVDRWRNRDPRRRSRHSALFTRALANRHPTGDPGSGRVTFRLLEPGIEPGERPMVVGDIPELGSWNPHEAIDMVPAPYPWWEATIDAPVQGFEYKYVVSAGHGVLWERGTNRAAPATSRATVINDDGIEGLADWRGAGVAIPVFSLRTDRGLGTGQFTDLVPLAEWAAANGLTVVQLLPVNDTVIDHSWQDSYPYNPVSVQALHPLYIDLDDIPDNGIGELVEEARAELNDLAEIDYPAVMARKWSLLRLAYRNLKDDLDADDAFARFVDREWDWLGAYSAWATLRDRHRTADFTKWAADSTFSQARIDAMADPEGADYDDLRFHWFVQFHLQRQLTASADHARSLGVALKGDLPIGVAPESVDMWRQPELFHVGAQTGAPPDAFAVLGQNWQFPTYDWPRMAEDGYRWWRDRFTALAQYVDVYRIDHVLGFFRIWEIPPDADDGLLGHFRPSLPLSADDVAAALGEVDIDALVSPLTTEESLEERFGDHAERVGSSFFSASEDGLRLLPGLSTQRRILKAFANGLLDDLPEDQRKAVKRSLLDVAADVLLLEVDGGYEPRISWTATEHYARLSPPQRAAFDAFAIDFFHHRHSELWEAQGRETLPAIVEATNLLTCGEDLGMVPDLVPRIMNELGLLSLEIERMPKRLGAWSADPSEAPYLSVVSPSTHDTTTLRMWWEDDRDVAERFWAESLGMDGEAPAVLGGDLAEAMIRRQMASEAMLCIVPMSDLLAIDETLRRDDPAAERINDPADRHNKWRYRMHLSLDELAAAGEFNERVSSIVSAAGR